jgi:hypothetical protein
MRSCAKHYKHVVVDFDERCNYSRGEECADIKDVIDDWIRKHGAYARVNAWFGISTVTVVYVKLYPGSTTITSSVSFDKGARRIGYLASTVITSALHLSRVLARKARRRGAINRVVKEFFENIKGRPNDAALNREIDEWIAEKREISTVRGKGTPSL